jgi:hypothetical protein
MKVFKLEVVIIDEDVETIDDAISIIDETRYLNHVDVHVLNCREVDIGEWEDDNPLNYEDTFKVEVDRLFPPENPGVAGM